ncbi:MAG: leucine-rich repeat domain-containing protein [Kiritimatiellae bacterium]|nr:leucine-rich repeat domain-containing protein [Kiritimatiellia bacterium]
MWSYDIVGEGAEITAVDSKPDGNLNIPTHLGGKPVVSLGGNALFYACSGLVEVRIPGSVTNIGNATFAFCSNHASVNIPDGVKSIGSRAFYWCDGLSDISLPDGVGKVKKVTSSFRYPGRVRRAFYGIIDA